MSVLDVIYTEAQKHHNKTGKAPTRLYIGHETYDRLRQQERHLNFYDAAGYPLERVMGLDLFYTCENNHLFVC